MIRILHAADLHLDSPFAAMRPDQAAVRREEQRQVLRRLVQACSSLNCQILLLAGDLFDSDRVYLQTAELLRRELASCKAPVFIAPGNHDYYGPSSPYAAEDWPDNVHIFRSRKVEAVRPEGLELTVYGAAFTGPHMPPDLAGFRAGAGPSVMVVHGEYTDGPSLYGPVSEAFAAQSALSYLALGHVHGGFVRKAGTVTIGNPGCAMGRGFDETGEKGALCVELSEEGCRVRPVSLGARQYRIYSVDVTDREPVQAVLAALPEQAKEEICRLVLTGTCFGVDRTALRTALEGRVYDLEITDRTLPPLELWAELGEDSLKGAFLRRLRDIYDAAEESGKADAALAAKLTLSLMDGREVTEE